MPSNCITLNVEGKTITARYSGPHGADVQRMFATDTLPTAYTTDMPDFLNAVPARLQELNPTCVIEWDDSILRTMWAASDFTRSKPCWM